MEGDVRATCRVFYRTTCAFYTHHHEYRAAAAAMYTYSQRLEHEFREAVGDTEETQGEGDDMREEERKGGEEKREAVRPTKRKTKKKKKTEKEEEEAHRRGEARRRALVEYLNDRLSALAAATGALRAAPAGQRWLLSFDQGEEEEEEEEEEAKGEKR